MRRVQDEWQSKGLLFVNRRHVSSAGAWLLEPSQSRRLWLSGFGQAEAWVEETTKELSYGSRFTFVANWHSDSDHPSDLAVRRSARLGVTNVPNNVVAITRILFQSRHAWLWHHQCRYCVSGCGGAILGMS
jgi:hypothetical protein